jgi:histidinol phosphatase-like PHP family hydrolase
MLNEKEKLTKRCEELKNQNEELMTLIEKYQIALENMKKEKNERADKSMRVSMLRPEKHAREQSYPSY